VPAGRVALNVAELVERAQFQRWVRKVAALKAVSAFTTVPERTPSKACVGAQNVADGVVARTPSADVTLDNGHYRVTRSPPRT
jgi:hypothetical protein